MIVNLPKNLKMIMYWNIIGLNSSLKQSEVKAMIIGYKVVLKGVLETKIMKENFVVVSNNLKLNEWSIEHNYLMSDQGRIWVLYDIRVVSLVVVESNSQFIYCRITW